MTLDRRIATLERATPTDEASPVVLHSPLRTVVLGGQRLDRADDESEAAFVQRVGHTTGRRALLVQYIKAPRRNADEKRDLQ
jgi:hypothetical protein